MAIAVQYVGLAAAAVLVAGCTEVGDGLRSPGGPAEVCVPADAGGIATISLDRFKNVAGHPVTIVGVSLVGGHDLQVAGWYAVLGDGPTPGVTHGYTPPSAPTTDLPVGEEATVVLGLQVAGDEGRAEASEVTYTVGSSRPRTVRGHIAHRVVAEGAPGCF
ncbi:hypothetical protein [Georgenia thermotolerans]|uniref:Uncharacterized protein n=1 Tax=Georgenia thermotolerans TaxID=527326 RepID=A0A7J5UTZ3_9MICO|nr:hypothetical protein [Georgenia thermotolerans]KAE8765730.1 hypothetical protein GB883_02125 [Georgenia thermotolerans]